MTARKIRHNIITEQLYNDVKKVAKAPADDKKVVREFGISYTTARKIRNTRDFSEYRYKTIASHGKTITREIHTVNLACMEFERLKDEPEDTDNTDDENKVTVARALGFCLALSLVICTVALAIWLVRVALGF